MKTRARCVILEKTLWGGIVIASRLSKSLVSAMRLAKPILGNLDYAASRAAQDRLDLLIHPAKEAGFERLTIGELNAAWVRPEAPASARNALLYCHGGSYVAGSLAYARILASRLAVKTGLDTLALEYRLAPEHPFPAAPEDLFSAYSWLVGQGYEPGRIALAGESAGGGLILSLPQRLRRLGLPMPGALVCMSPWTNLACTFESCVSNLENDPILIPESLELAGRMYAGRESVFNPLISPAFADFSGFPPALFQAGSLEVLLDDSRVCHEKMLESGADSRLEIYEEMWHVFQIQNIPEADLALSGAAAFLREKLGY